MERGYRARGRGRNAAGCGNYDKGVAERGFGDISCDRSNALGGGGDEPATLGGELRVIGSKYIEVVREGSALGGESVDMPRKVSDAGVEVGHLDGGLG